MASAPRRGAWPFHACVNVKADQAGQERPDKTIGICVASGNSSIDTLVYLLLCQQLSGRGLGKPFTERVDTILVFCFVGLKKILQSWNRIVIDILTFRLGGGTELFGKVKGNLYCVHFCKWFCHCLTRCFSR